LGRSIEIANIWKNENKKWGRLVVKGMKGQKGFQKFRVSDAKPGG